MRKGVEYLMRSNQVTVYEGTARTLPGAAVEGKDGVRTIEAKTSSQPRAPGLAPPAWSRTEAHLTSGTRWLRPPPSMINIGAGATGVVASLFNTFGVQVTLGRRCPAFSPWRSLRSATS